MNKKLVEGAESFKQFVVDEYNQLFKLNQTLVENNDSMQKRYNNLQNKHQDLTTLSLKLTDENERMYKKLATIGNLSKIDLLERQLQAMAASHADLINKNVKLRSQNDSLIKENNNLKQVNTNLSRSNAKHIGINGELIKFLDTLGFGVEVVPIEQADTIDKEFLKKLLGLKYQVEEVKPEAAEVKHDINFLKDLLVNGLGKDFHVEVIGGDEKSQQVVRDLFGNLEAERKSGRNDKRDNLGRYASPKK